MTTQNRSKLNRVFTEWPHETVITLKWLANKGVSRFLARSYVKGDWIKPIGPGAFVKAEAKPLWTGGLHALQNQLKLPVHAGGETALRLDMVTAITFLKPLPVMTLRQRLFLYLTVNFPT